MHDLDGHVEELEGFEFEDDFDEDDEEFMFETDDDDDEEYESNGILTSAEEMELAAELLEVSTDEELEEFIKKAFRKVRRKAKRFFKSKVGRKLKGALKKVARKALPFVGGAIGNLVAPGVGGAIGSRLASSAGKVFGLELEGLSPDEQEFEMARRFVRLTTDAAANAASDPDGDLEPNRTVRVAIQSAAQKHAPGLLRTSHTRSRNAGRWVRKGDRIVLLGA